MINLEIILASYNGSKYIAAQIDSILSQSYKDFKLYIRDDCSTDETASIINNFAKKHPDRISIIDNKNTRLGVTQNFAEILKNCQSDYIMFSDQDDVWLSNKVELTLKKMKEAESRYGNIPILVHTDSKVVDNNLNILSPSFVKYQNLKPEKRRTFKEIMVQNNVTGCTMMINNNLKNMVLPIPSDVIIYDWYIALVASATGVVEFLNEQTMLYRQHTANSIGAKGYTYKYLLSSIDRLFNRERLINSQKQVQTILHNNLIPHPEIEQIAAIFSSLHFQPLLVRKYLMLKHGFFKTGFIRNIGLFLQI